MGNYLNFGTLLCILFSTTFSLASASEKVKRVAYSKNFGIEVFAVFQGASWCHRAINVELKAADPNIFKSTKISAFIKKIGAVLPTECEQAHQLNIEGKDQQNQLHFKAEAITKDQIAWQVTVLKSAPLIPKTPLVATPSLPPKNPLSPTTKDSASDIEPKSTSVIADSTSNTYSNENGLTWLPPKLQQSIKYSEGAQDYEISTNDWRCKLKINHLNSPREQKLLVLKPQGLGCDESRLAYGQGVANINYYDGRTYERLKGNFYLGYHFDYNVDISNKLLLHRTRLNQKEALTFYLGKIPTFDTQLIGVLFHTNQGWSFSQGVIIALTQNKSLFKNTRLIKQLEQAVSAKASTISHGSNAYTLYVMEQLQLPVKQDSEMLYTAQFTKQNSQWQVADDSIKNYIAGNINQATQTALSQASLASRIQLDTSPFKVSI